MMEEPMSKKNWIVAAIIFMIICLGVAVIIVEHVNYKEEFVEIAI